MSTPPPSVWRLLVRCSHLLLHPLRNRRRELYTGAEATLMEAALNLCEWKLKHNIKTAAFERLSKVMKKHMLPKDGSELTETWYQVEQCLNVPDIKKYIVHCCPCDEHRYGDFLDGDWRYDDRCPRCNLTRWTPESLRHPRPATPQPRKFYYDFNVCEVMRPPFRMPPLDSIVSA